MTAILCCRKIVAQHKEDRRIFSHVALPNDVSNAKFIFNAMVAAILEENLKASGHAGATGHYM